MNTLYTDLQKLVQDHCDAVVCVNGSMLAKDLRALLERHKHKAALQELTDQAQELKLGYEAITTNHDEPNVRKGTDRTTDGAIGQP